MSRLPIIVKHITRLSFSDLPNRDAHLRNKWKDWERNAAQEDGAMIEVQDSVRLCQKDIFATPDPSC